MAICLAAGCVSPETHRIHARHMVEGERYKLTFDRRFPIGTSLKAVEQYLREQGLVVRESMSAEHGGQLLVEVFTEESPSWYCGTGSVGLVVGFSSGQLISTTVSSWSFDCP
jgi:hypothetical protein